MKRQRKNLWWQKGVIYQIYPCSFQDSDGNGVGDIYGIINRLDYLNDGTPNSLGIDAIWLSPIYPSPMVDYGYDVANYIDINPIFGDLEIFDKFVIEAHRRGIKVILDFIPNHTSCKHPWFQKSRSLRNNPKRDWYIWQDSKADGGPPNNWLSMFGGSSWERDKKTQQYYLHSFLKEQPDLNWRNPEVKEAMLDVLRFWFDRGVDGFRIDAINSMIKDDKLRDDPSNPKYIKGRDDPQNSLLHIYSRNRPGLHNYLRDFRRVSEEYDERLLLGEVWLSDLRKWARYYGGALNKLHLPFNFGLILTHWDAKSICKFIARLEATIPFGAWPNYVLGNHDISRLATRNNAEHSRIAAMLLLTLRGTPTLYYGDEIGMHDVAVSAKQKRDPMGRDPERTPMQWDSTSYAGFSTAKPWLPVARDYKSINVAKEKDDPTSLLNLYRRLIWVRRESVALHSGDYRSLNSGSGDSFVYLREFDKEQILVALNFSSNDQTLSLSKIAKYGRVLLSTYLDRKERIDTRKLYLRAHEGCLISLF